MGEFFLHRLPALAEGAATRANQRGVWHTNDVSPHTYQLFYRFTFLLIVILVCQTDNNLCTTLSSICKFCEYNRFCPFLHFPYVPKRNMCIFCTSWLTVKFFHFIEILLLNGQVFLFRKREQQKSHYIDRWSAVFTPKESKTRIKQQMFVKNVCYIIHFCYLSYSIRYICGSKYTQFTAFTAKYYSRKIYSH